MLITRLCFLIDCIFIYFLLATTYSTVEALVRSLKEGKVDYVVVDMYLPVKRKDLFNGTWFEIVALLEVELYHGVILQGDAFKLASALEGMIRNDNVQTKFLEDQEKEEVVFTPIAFFSLLSVFNLKSRQI